ncbi:MAG: ArsR family transcriptional regulator [Candidatus Bathyarchaeia archaeon]|nr:MarR family transcriptional regulator [Candidatus Bathyarchaeota archaeon]
MSEEMVVTGNEAITVVDALTSTSLRILQLLSKERLDVSMIGERLGLSEAYISEQVRRLEELKLIRVDYERGTRGIRKMCQTTVNKITIIIKSETTRTNG